MDKRDKNLKHESPKFCAFINIKTFSELSVLTLWHMFISEFGTVTIGPVCMSDIFQGCKDIASFRNSAFCCGFCLIKGDLDANL